MRKIIFPVIFSLIFIMPLRLALASPDLTYSCTGIGACSLSNTSPLFNVTNFAPGDLEERTIRIVNNSGDTECNLAMSANETSTPGEYDLADQLFTSVWDGSDYNFGSEISGKPTDQGTLKDMYELTDPLPLGLLPDGDETDFVWKVYFSPLAGNEYQGKETTFDVDLSIDCLDCEKVSAWMHSVETLYTQQGTRKDDKKINPNQIEPGNTLGANDGSIFSVGKGGYITLKLQFPVNILTQATLTFYENHEPGQAQESVKVWIMESPDGTKYPTDGMIVPGNIGTSPYVLDLDTVQGLPATFQYIRIEDDTDYSLHDNPADGYDIDAIKVETTCPSISSPVGSPASLSEQPTNRPSWWTRLIERFSQPVSANDLWASSGTASASSDTPDSPFGLLLEENPPEGEEPAADTSTAEGKVLGTTDQKEDFNYRPLIVLPILVAGGVFLTRRAYKKNIGE